MSIIRPKIQTGEITGQGAIIYGGLDQIYETIGKLIACVNDKSTHGGFIMTSGDDNTFLVSSKHVAVDGALHACPINDPTHPHGYPITILGVTYYVSPIKAITVKSFHNGKLILTGGAMAACGAVITPDPRNCYVE